MTSLLPPRNAYSDKDFASIRARVFNVIRSVFPDWTDESAANFDNILVESFAYATDTLMFYQDNQSRQSRLRDATVRRSVLAIAEQLGYYPKASQAAQVGLQITINNPAALGITLPTSLRIATRDGKASFRIIDPAIIPAGDTTVFVTAEHSEPVTETVSPIAEGLQVFVGNRSPWVENSEVVTSAGAVFTRVNTLALSGPDDKHYTVSPDSNDRPVFTFGNGVTGFKPLSTITMYYSIGGGTLGSVDANTITVPNTKTIRDASLNSYILTATNPESSIGGANRESLASIKKRAPLFARTNARTVSSDDYEINATRVTGVSRALLATSDNSPGLAENFGRLFIVPTNSGTPTSSMLSAVTTMITVTYPKTTTFRVQVEAAPYADIDLAMTIYISVGCTPSSVKAQILQRLQAFFAVDNSDGTPNENITFGVKYKTDLGQAESSIALSDVYNVVRDTPGVRKIGTTTSDFTLGGEHSDYTLSYFEFPRLGDVLIRNGDTGAIL